MIQDDAGAHPFGEAFDVVWYVRTYHDVPRELAAAARHFVQHGLAEGRRFHPLFDAEWYVRQNPDVAASAMTPTRHFLEQGLAEGRSPHPLFDPDFYQHAYPEAGNTGLPPFAHFLRHGLRNELSPHPAFNPAWYRRRNPEAANTELPAVIHYLEHGAAAGFSPHAMFDRDWYAHQNPDVAAGHRSPSDHFLSYGFAEGRSPHPLFDAEWYQRRYPDVAANELLPIQHFLRYGLKEGRSPHPVFDQQWYRAKHADVADFPEDPFLFFLEIGLDRGDVPGPLFDKNFYLERYQDIASSRLDPIRHYIYYGYAEGRIPNRIFDEEWYTSTYASLIKPSEPPFIHFARSGQFIPTDPHPLFDSTWYTQKYRNSLDGETSFNHYLRNGNNQPNRAFDTLFVVKQLRELDSPSTPPVSFNRANKFHEVHNRINDTAAELIIFTSITAEQLPQTLVLAESVRRHCPQARFVVFTCDRTIELPCGQSDSIDEVIEARSLWGDDFERWVFQRSAAEARAAVKGAALKSLLSRNGCRQVIYVDPAVVLYNELNPVFRELRNYSLVFTPNFLLPATNWQSVEQQEVPALRDGAFSAGFLAVRNDAHGRDFASWWSNRLEGHCSYDEVSGVFADQKWMDLAPTLFEGIGVLRHDGCNVRIFNLGERHISTDNNSRLSVKGKPLVFLDFSGHQFHSEFRSIIQNTGIGSAARALLETYKREVAVKAVLMSPLPSWEYGTYENGQIIKDSERRLYRQRLDLQMRFPNPFAVRPDQSFLHWYKRKLDRTVNASTSFVATVDPERTYLEAYLLQQAVQSIRPNHLFDPTYYRSTYADVRQSRLDPLAHFLQYGLVEGRRPSRDFDPIFYSLQLGPGSYTAAFWSALEDGIGSGHRPATAFLASWDSNVIDSLKASLTGDLPSILIINHFGGGGTSKNISDLCNSFADRANFIILAPGRNGFITVEIWNKSVAPLIFDKIDAPNHLADVLSGLPIDRVHVHHAFGLNEIVPRLVQELGRPYDVTLHDTYFITPNPLFKHGADARDPVGLDQAMRSSAVDPLDGSEDGLTDIRVYRDRYRDFLRRADRLIAPTHFIASVYTECDPILKPTVAPNIDPAQRGFPIKSRKLGPADKMRVGVIGDLADYKGANRVQQCALAARARQLPLQFTVIGEASHFVKGAGVSVIGRYDDPDLPKLLVRYGIDAIWLPYEAPESYSYVLSSALRSSLPVIISDVGCFPERTGGLPQVYMVSVETRPESWLDLMLVVRDQIIHGITFEAPPVPEHHAFYESEYLPVRL